jgi:hypothetical protein
LSPFAQLKFGMTTVTESALARFNASIQKKSTRLECRDGRPPDEAEDSDTEAELR